MNRRDFLSVAAMAAAAAAVGPWGVVAAAAPLDGQRVGPRPARPRTQPDWPEAAHDSLGQRHGPSDVAGLATRWRLHMPGGVPGAAAISRGCVYAASYGGDVVVADFNTGAVRWRRKLPIVDSGGRNQGFFGGPAVAEGLVMAASDRVWALDARTGRKVWTASPLSGGSGDDYFWGPPSIVGTSVLVGSGAGSETAPGRGRVSCYRLADGRLLWSTATVPAGGNGGGVIAPITADLSQGVAYALTGAPYTTIPGDNPGTCSLLEIRLSDGSIVWQDQVHPGDRLGRDFNSAPMLLGSLLLGTAKDGLYAWDRRERRRLWHTQTTPYQTSPGQAAGPTNGPEGGPLATDGTRAFFGSNDAAAGAVTVAAVDPGTGTVLWRQSLPGFEFGALAVAGDSLWVALASGDLYGLRAIDGAVVGHAALGDPSTGAVSAAFGSVLVGTGIAPYLPGDSLVCLG
jgi:outer membrane protein assembly factor BamB